MGAAGRCEGRVLLEVAMASVLLAFALSMAYRSTDANTSVQKHMTMKTQLEGRADKLLARIGELLSEASGARRLSRVGSSTSSSGKSR